MFLASKPIMGFSRKKLYLLVENINVFEVDSLGFPIDFNMTPPGNPRFYSNFDIPPGTPTTFTLIPLEIFH